jgi:hypothetical protein
MLVTYDWFQNTYLGQGVTSDDYPRLEMRAEEIVSVMTRGATDGFEAFPEAVKTLVKKAICAQVEYYGAYSTEVGFKAEDEGFTVGKVSLQGSGANGESGSKMFYSPRAVMFLEQAGLMNRNVGVIC